MSELFIDQDPDFKSFNKIETKNHQMKGKEKH